MKGPPATNGKAQRGRGEGSDGFSPSTFRPLLVNHPRVAVSFLGPQRKTFLSTPGEKARFYARTFRCEAFERTPSFPANISPPVAASCADVYSAFHCAFRDVIAN